MTSFMTFVAAGVWDSAPLDAALLKEADRLVGDRAGFLLIDDTALPMKGLHNVGVAPQYASSLGKTSNCQSLVSVTLASREVPAMVGLRLSCPRPGRVIRADDAGSGPERTAGRSDKAGDRHRRDRPRHGLRSAVRLCAGRRRVWLQRGVRQALSERGLLRDDPGSLADRMTGSIAAIYDVAFCPLVDAVCSHSIALQNIN